MLNIRFVRNSLLYGESCYLFLNCFLAPFFLFPDVAATRTKHFLGVTNFRRKLMHLLQLGWQLVPVRLAIVGFITITQVSYALLLVTFGIIVQNEFLKQLDLVDQKELAHKVLYSAPILQRMGLFLMISMALWNRTNYREWPVFDHYVMFSVSLASQTRIVILCSLLLVPDLLCSWADMMLLLEPLRAEPYKLLQFTLASPSIDVAFLSLATAVNTTSSVIRHKPFISLMYAIICTRKHMRLLREQLHACHQHSKGKGKGKSKGSGRRPSTRVATFHGSEAALISAGNAQLQAAPGERPAGHRIELYINSELALESLPARRLSSLSLAAESPAEVPGRAEPPGHPLCRLQSLFELERHLTQVYLFVAAIDRCSPGRVVALATFNLLAFFYTLLYVLAAPAGRLSWPMAALYLVGRVLPLCVLFLAGFQVERECRKLTNLLEIIYLEDSSHSLLYKQLKDSQRSLARIFRLLARIKFDGDGLMAFNADTLKRLIFYLAGAIFVVIQYDSLLVMEDSASVREPPGLPGARARPAHAF